MAKRLLHMTRRILDVGRNHLASVSGPQLSYIVEADTWSIKEDGRAIAHALNGQRLLRARVSTSAVGLRNQIVHFGSANTFFREGGWRRVHPSNRVVLTWFHVVPGDERLKHLPMAQRELHRIHTSCETTKQALLEAGVDGQKIVVIPLGIDLELFKPATDGSRRAVRERLGIPQNRFVIGSFQKDGVGWNEGLEPKLEKGPDIFVGTLARLKHLNPLVLLTGPSRGYVKRGLTQHSIDFVHIYPKRLRDLAPLYHALDAYLISSRVEGGPKALLECWASGVPVVSTRTGMVTDLAQDNETALLANVEDVRLLASQVERLHHNTALRETLALNALTEVRNFSWDIIARRYQEKLYQLPYESLPTR